MRAPEFQEIEKNTPNFKAGEHESWNLNPCFEMLYLWPLPLTTATSGSPAQPADTYGRAGPRSQCWASWETHESGLEFSPHGAFCSFPKLFHRELN